MFDTIHLTNMLRSEVEGIPETGLPLDAFPDKIQEIILNLARYENFNRQLLSYPYKGRVENLPISLYDVGRSPRAW